MTVIAGRIREEAQTIVARYPQGRERSAIMPLLYLVQSEEGMVTREGLREVADLLDLTSAEVESVATFYTMYRLRPTGEHLVNVCTNLACMLRGAKDVYEAAHQAAGMAHGQEISEDGMITLHEEECIGVCDFAPAVQIDTRPRPAPRSAMSCASAPRMRAPVAPNGWPTAMLLPRGLSRARSTSPSGS